MKSILTRFYFSINLYKILPFQYLISIKILRYFIFCVYFTYFKSTMYFTHLAFPSLGKSHFKCSKPHVARGYCNGQPVSTILAFFLASPESVHILWFVTASLQPLFPSPSLTDFLTPHSYKPL